MSSNYTKNLDSHISELENMDFKSKLSTVIGELEQKFIEREEILRLMILAIFAKQHIFLIGPPGVGKTYLLKIILSMVEDAKLWEIQMTKDTKEKNLFGDENTPIEETMMNGSQFFFFDEMFKATDDLLVSTLTVWNERYYTHKGKSVEIPVYSLFAASNEIPFTEKIEPFIDRLLIWYEIRRIQKPENFLRYLRGDFDKSKDLSWKFNIETIDFVYAKAMSEVKFSKESEKKYLQLKDAILKDGIPISDRKLGEKFIISALKVSAFLNNRREIDYSDLMLILHMAWSKGVDERDKLREVVYSVVFGSKNRVDDTIFKILDFYEQIYSKLQRDFGVFLNYVATIEGQNKDITFRNIRNNIANYLAQMNEALKTMKEEKEIYDFVMHLNTLMENNILLYKIKDNVYNTRNTEQIFTFISLKQNDIDSVAEWLDRNIDFFNYEENRCSIGNKC